MKQTTTLDKIKLLQQAEIVSLHCTDSLIFRLHEMGWIPGTTVIPLFSSCLCDPTAYWVKGATIALRKEDAAKIRVKVQSL